MVKDIREELGKAVDTDVRFASTDNLDIHLQDSVAMALILNARLRVSHKLFEVGMTWADNSIWELTRYINGEEHEDA